MKIVTIVLIRVNTKKSTQRVDGKSIKKAGSDLLSRGRAAVPSARERFTSVFGMGTGISTLLWPPADQEEAPKVHPMVGGKREGQYGQASRMISNGRLNASPRLHRRPIDQLFWLVPSVESSSMGHLILGRASRLDAFSGYPFRTWLPCECRWRDNRYTRGPSTSVLSY